MRAPDKYEIPVIQLRKSNNYCYDKAKKTSAIWRIKSLWSKQVWSNSIPIETYYDQDENAELVSRPQAQQTYQPCQPQAACHTQIPFLREQVHDARSRYQLERHERLLLDKQYNHIVQQFGKLGDQYVEVCRKYMSAHTAMCNLEESCKELDFQLRSENATRLEAQMDLQQERSTRAQIQTKLRYNTEATQTLAGIVHLLLVHRADLSEEQRSEIDQKKLDFTSLLVEREYLRQERDELSVLLRERDGHRKRGQPTGFTNDH
ncbi:MAG: hypothetical protein Q9198_001118 [Flavoplaca austrocitrina]